MCKSAFNAVFLVLISIMLISGKGQNPTEDEIEDMIDDADEDGSGSINFPEFVGLMMKKQEGTISKEDIKQVRITSKSFRINFETKDIIYFFIITILL